ncbi:hypothetical protein ACHAXT_008354 [Thalassiosira profunda]
MLSRASRLLGPRCGARAPKLPTRAASSAPQASLPTSHLVGSTASSFANNGLDGVPSYPPSIFGRVDCYHKVSFSTKTRRRRRGGGGGGGGALEPQTNANGASADDQPASSSAGQFAPLSTEQFLSASAELLDRVESSLSKLQDCNEGLEITRYPPSQMEDVSAGSNDADGDEEEDPQSQPHGGQLSIQVQSTEDLYWGGGTYWLTIHPGSDGESGGYVTLRSPLSGTFTYVYDVAHKEWVGTEDGHSLLGMLTRDWIRQCQGVPDF